MGPEFKKVCLYQNVFTILNENFVRLEKYHFLSNKFGFSCPDGIRSSGRESKNCLGQVFNIKSGCFVDMHELCGIHNHAHL
jgi:hypothetical protein